MTATIDINPWLALAIFLGSCYIVNRLLTRKS